MPILGEEPCVFPGDLLQESTNTSEQGVRQLADLIAVGAPLTVEQRLCAGRKARIRNGPLAGFEGTIIQRRGTDRLLIGVNFLQQGVSIEINGFLVEPVWPSRTDPDGTRGSGRDPGDRFFRDGLA